MHGGRRDSYPIREDPGDAGVFNSALSFTQNSSDEQSSGLFVAGRAVLRARAGHSVLSEAQNSHDEQSSGLFVAGRAVLRARAGHSVLNGVQNSLC